MKDTNGRSKIRESLASSITCRMLGNESTVSWLFSFFLICHFVAAIACFYYFSWGHSSQKLTFAKALS